MRLFIILAAMPLLCPLSAWAEDGYTLLYKKENKWVAQDDAAPLKALLDASKKDDSTAFEVILPESDRKLAIARLKILRDILDQSLGHGILLQEIDGETPTNSLKIIPKK